ncbi:MAG TPA: YHS domain-containing (seleno)protein [Thermoanaerobaculia bacterium]|nr:YHS domain-containing (seleno)protein [Thermoanaerobaculia bacterium]
MTTTRTVLATALLGLLATLPARATDPVNKSTFGGLALDGYDAVAYFTDGKPVEGISKFEHTWQGAKWRFANEVHRDLFAANPEKYAPQYGGYCAWAVSQGYTADADPKAWKIVDGKLYLNYNAKVQKDWEKDVPGNIAKADANWPEVLEK